MSKPGTLSDHDLLDGLKRAIQEIKSSGTLSPDLLATVEDLIEEALHRGMPGFHLDIDGADMYPPGGEGYVVFCHGRKDADVPDSGFWARRDGWGAYEDASVYTSQDIAKGRALFPLMMNEGAVVVSIEDALKYFVPPGGPRP